jgi:hypothetical protein
MAASYFPTLGPRDVAKGLFKKLGVYVFFSLAHVSFDTIFPTINKLKLFFECGNSMPQDADTPLLALWQIF